MSGKWRSVVRGMHTQSAEHDSIETAIDRLNVRCIIREDTAVLTTNSEYS